MPPKKDKAPSKAQLMILLSERSGVPKSDVIKVMSALDDTVKKSLKSHREFTLPGLLKVRVAHRKATKARPGRNPQTGETITIKAKPAHDVVRARVLKGLKDVV